MSDKLWKKKLNTITDPKELLKELVRLEDAVAGLGDPYYDDLYQAIIEQAKRILRDTPGD